MSVDLGAPRLKAIRIIVVAVDGLAKPDMFSLPDPFAIVVVDSNQRYATSVIKNTLDPYWDEHFDIMVKGSSVITVQIFDQRKFNRRDQGFLGFVEIRVTDYLDLELGGQETVQLDLKGTDDNPAVQGRLISHLSTIPTTRSVNNTLVNNYSANNYSANNYSVNDYPVNNYSTYNASVYAASVNSASVSELYNPSIRLSRTLSSHTTSSGVTTPVMAIPPTPIPGTHFGQQPRYVSSGGTSTADHPHNTPRVSARGIVSPGQSMTNAQHNPYANEDHIGPLPEGWESGIDPLGLTYYVNHHTCSITRNRPSPNQFFDHQAPEGETNTTSLGSLSSGWDERRTSDGRLYYVDHNTRITTWDNPRLLSHKGPRYIDNLSQKLIHFRSRPAMRPQPGDCEIKVWRDDLFEDGFAEIMRQTPNDLKRRLMIKFKGRDGSECVVPPREFLFLLSHEMFNPTHCLFEHSSHDNHKLQIDAASNRKPGHLNYFKFIGRVLGVCIFHRCLLDASFTVPFHKMILKKKVTLVDLESVDVELHRRLTWILDNDITDLINETFTEAEIRFSVMVLIDLKPGGAGIAVTEENKKEYVNLMVKYHISKRVKVQFDAFMSGFEELIPRDLIKVFDEHELELLIGGTSEIDVDDWAKYTIYRGYKSNDKVIQWFWRCIRSWPAVRRSRLLRFATGTTRIPITGFCDLQGPYGTLHFTIERTGGPLEGHAYFNRIALPTHYGNCADLEQNLTLTIDRSLEHTDR